MSEAFHVILHATEAVDSKFDCSFEQVTAALEELPRMFLEPDGSFVWVIEDGESRGVPQQVGIPTEYPVAGRMESPAGYPGGSPLDQFLDSTHHLAGRLIGEREQEDPSRRHTIPSRQRRW